MADEPIVHGMRELAEELMRFPEKLQRKALTQVARRGGRPVARRARAKLAARSKSGKLARSIRVTVVQRRAARVVIARVIAGNNRKKDDPFYAHMVEGGTEPHEIRPKGAKSLFFAGLMREVVQHPGADPAPFLKPALEEGAQESVDAMQEELAAQIEKLKAGP